MNYDELSEALYGSKTPEAVELASLKVMVAALSVLLLDKGICSRKEIQKYVTDAYTMYQTLKTQQETKDD
jgi:hypothetical protein